MECLCRLKRKKINVGILEHNDTGKMRSHLRTSFGSPNSLKTSDLACVYPYAEIYRRPRAWR